MNLIPLYIAAAVCGLIGAFLGLMQYLDRPTREHEPDYNIAGAWITACVALLILSTILSSLP